MYQPDPKSSIGVADAEECRGDFSVYQEYADYLATPSLCQLERLCGGLVKHTDPINRSMPIRLPAEARGRASGTPIRTTVPGQETG